ncbi:MAG TPA: flagellar hook-basal body protein, partial [Sphingomicrobium sp.]|nr:flagellar hook-basal body protein [Sphingomicrobium sp.]
KALDTIANNISNISTSGFKRTEVRFTEVLASQPDSGVARADLGASAATSSGVRSDLMQMLNEQGKVESTGDPMDLAINGSGFIELMGAGGQTMLWRGGKLKVGDEGRLTTVSGLELKANITVPGDTTNLEIGSDGVVRAKAGSSEEMVETGQIRLVKLDDPANVEVMDGGLYRVRDGVQLTDARPGEDGAGMLVQGSVERSTVELNQEMVEMLMVQRAYAANAQIVQAADQLAGLANNLRK